MLYRALPSLLAGLALTMPAGILAADGKLPLFVGVGQETSQSLPLNEQNVPSHDRPQFYVSEARPRPGIRPPPDWIVRWVSAELAHKGFVEARGAPASLLLTFEWGPVDEQISRVGRPLQLIDPGSRPVLSWRETNYHRAYAGEASTFCVVTAFDLTASRENPARWVRLWQTKMWFALIRPRPHEKIEIGPLAFKGYLESAEVPPPRPAPSPTRADTKETRPLSREANDDTARSRPSP